MIDIHYIGCEVEIPWLKKHLMDLLSTEKDVPMLRYACQLLGKLCVLHSTFMSEAVESFGSQAFEWLSFRSNSSVWHAAILVLSQLANNAPTYIYKNMQLVLDVSVVIFLILESWKDYCS